MYYIAKSLFFQVLSFKVRTFFSFILNELRILIATTRQHQERGRHVVAFRVLVYLLCYFYSISAMCIVVYLCM